MNDGIAHLHPRVPQWAIDAGCPPAAVDETLREYVERIGLSYPVLVSGLTERTAICAHIRLSNMLADRCPSAWQAHLDEFVKAHRANGSRRPPTL